MAEHDSGARNGDAAVGESNRPVRDLSRASRAPNRTVRDGLSGTGETISTVRDLTRASRETVSTIRAADIATASLTLPSAR